MCLHASKITGLNASFAVFLTCIVVLPHQSTAVWRPAQTDPERHILDASARSIRHASDQRRLLRRESEAGAEPASVHNAAFNDMRTHGKVPKFVRVRAQLLQQGLDVGKRDEISAVSGTYILVPGQTPGGYPLWRQRGDNRNHWLFSGRNGHWIVGGEEEKRQGFDCTHGILTSATPHNGVMPNPFGLRPHWQFLQKKVRDSDLGLASQSPQGLQDSGQELSCKPCQAVQSLFDGHGNVRITDDAFSAAAYVSKGRCVRNPDVSALSESKMSGDGFTFCSDAGNGNIPSQFLGVDFGQRVRITHISTIGVAPRSNSNNTYANMAQLHQVELSGEVQDLIGEDSGFVPQCAHSHGWSYVLDYNDDKATDDIPDDPDVVNEGFSNQNAFFIGREQLKGLRHIGEVQLCGRMRSKRCEEHCVDVLETNFSGCFCENLREYTTPLQKAIALLAGVCANTGNKGADATGCALRISGDAFTCPQHTVWHNDYQNLLFAAGGHGGWRKWGSGVALSLDGLGNERSYEFGWPPASPSLAEDNARDAIGLGNRVTKLIAEQAGIWGLGRCRKWAPDTLQVRVRHSHLSVQPASLAIGQMLNRSGWVSRYKVDSGPLSDATELSGNVDSTSPLVNTLASPLETKFLRFLPLQWRYAPALRWDLLGCACETVVREDVAPDGECSRCSSVRPLIGSETEKAIEDSAITASSYIADKTELKGRLNSAHGWVSGKNEEGQHIEARFFQRMRVTHVITQGVGTMSSASWVRSYKVGLGWEPSGAALTASNPSWSSNVLSSPIEDTYVMLFPVTWQSQMALRWELMGCECNPVDIPDVKPKAECMACGGDNFVRPLVGPSFAKIVSDQSLTASSYWNDEELSGKGEMWRLRLDWHGGSSWRSGSDDLGEYVQVTFPEKKRITRIKTRGNYAKPEWVVKYKVGQADEPGDLTLHGNVNQFDTVEQMFPVPLETDHVKIFPVAFHGHMAMRLDLMGCDCISVNHVHHTEGRGIPSQGKKVVPEQCTRRLVGGGARQRLVPDSMIVASNLASSDAKCLAASGRLHAQGAACLHKSDSNEAWLMWDLGQPTTIHKVQIQGRPDEDEWITKFRLEGSNSGAEWKVAGNFDGNVDRNTVVEHDVAPPLFARFVRLIATDSAGAPSLRAELIGCGQDGFLWESLLIGKVSRINFQLIRPRLYNGRVFYYLDNDLDGGWSSGHPDGDTVEPVWLQDFLPWDNMFLAEDNNVLKVSGNLLRVPDKQTLREVLSGSENERGSAWPEGLNFLSASRDGQMHNVLSHRRTGQAHETSQTSSQKVLVPLELVQLHGQPPYLLTAGKCQTTEANEPPATWPDGTQTFSKQAMLGSILMCQEFCTRKAPACRGFAYNQGTKTCHWHRGDFQPSDGSFDGWDCYTSKLFQCSYSKSKCGEGFVPKSGDTWCTNICSRDDCCEPKGICTPDVCGQSYLLKPTVPRHCIDRQCTKDECCTARAVCTADVCESPAFAVKLSNLPSFCVNSTCSSDECCVANPTCRESDCPAPFVLKQKEPLYCEGERCTMIECCVEVSTCERFWCPVGSRELPKESLCSSLTCTDKDCCESLGTCKADFADGCPLGYRLLDDAQVPPLCEDASCTKEECCTNALQCTPEICTSGLVPRSAREPINCGGDPCTPDECCATAGECRSDVCGVSTRLLTVSEGRPETCQGDLCTEEECCKRVGHCAEYACPDGWGEKQPKDAPETCTDSQCTTHECCLQLGQCTADVCMEGQRVMRVTPKFCSDAVCDQKECCATLAKCTDYQDMCQLSVGYIVKPQRPQFCLNEYCQQEECCQPAATCTKSACPVGMRLSYDVYCASAEGCTPEECCEAGLDEEASLIEASSPVEARQALGNQAATAPNFKAAAATHKRFIAFIFALLCAVL